MKLQPYRRLIRLGPGFSQDEPVLPPTLKWRQLAPIADGDWIEGYLVRPFHVGEGFRLKTFVFNGKVCKPHRWYFSSTVEAVLGDQVFTQHARYKVMRVPLLTSGSFRP